VEKSISVGIVLATYNGALWLQSQLESLENQSYPHWTCWIRDDGSTDQTSRIIQEALKRDQRYRVIPSEERLGAIHSFGKLLHHARACDYVFFCDQDDVWHSEKIADYLKAFRETESLTPKIPILIQSDLELVDESLNLIARSMKQRMNFGPTSTIFPKLLAQNTVTGCTVAINRALIDLALPLPAAILMHDHWLALLASSSGKIISLSKTYIQYRQHGKNVSGPAKPKSLVQGFLFFVRQFHWVQKTTHQRLEQAWAVEQRLQERNIQGDSLNLLKNWHAAWNLLGGIGAALKGFKLGIKMQGFSRTFAFYLSLVLLKSNSPSKISSMSSGDDA
jgi:glycosyltransferase involved in cell wall biosynthesis